MYAEQESESSGVQKMHVVIHLNWSLKLPMWIKNALAWQCFHKIHQYQMSLKKLLRASPLAIHIQRQMGRLNFTGILHEIKGPEDSICTTLHTALASAKCSYLACTKIPFFWDMTLCHRVNGSSFPSKHQTVIALWHSVIPQNIILKTHIFYINSQTHMQAPEHKR